MAQRVHIDLVDDIDGSEAEESVGFGLDGHTYDIDLNAKHAEQLRGALEPYVTHARITAGRKRPRSAGRPRSTRIAFTPAVALPVSEDPSVIREWAAANGVEVSSRGRISAAVRAEYLAAH